MKRLSLLLIQIAFGFLIFTSCESEKPGNSENLKSDSLIKSEPDSNLISFKRDIQPLFDEDCSGCHDYLKNGASYKMLTTKETSCKLAPNYIDTVNPTSSYIYVKLHDAPPSGTLMKGDHWTPENVQKLLLWIEQGAKNN